MPYVGSGMNALRGGGPCASGLDDDSRRSMSAQEDALR